MAFSEEAALAAAADRVRARFSQLPSDMVEEALSEARARFDGRPIRDFVPILVERAATRTLRTTSRTTLAERTRTPAMA